MTVIPVIAFLGLVAIAMWAGDQLARWDFARPRRWTSYNVTFQAPVPPVEETDAEPKS